MEYYKVVEGDEQPGNGSDIMEYQGRFKRAVALHMAKKRERRQKRAAMKAMMFDQLKKKAEEFGIKMETRRPAHYVYGVGPDMTSPQVRYTEMPPPYEPQEKPDPMTDALQTIKEGLAKMEAARKTY